jgi:hypothetical protein
VFNHEQLLECCGCYVTPNGSRDWASVKASFDSNNLTGSPVPTIVVKQVTSLGTGANVFTDCDKNTVTITPDGSVFCPEQVTGASTCDPRVVSKAEGIPGLISWAVKTQTIGSTTGVTETASQSATLSFSELVDLPEDCGGVMDFGTGQGICSCGAFD